MRQVTQFFARAIARQDHLKFVAPQTPHAPGFSDNLLQSLRHLFEQGIARRMAQRIIDLLEPVEVEQENGADTGLNLRGRENSFQRLRHAKPVGQTGQRIEMGQPIGVFLRTALFGQVRARPAKALKRVGSIVGRPTRNGPPAFLAATRHRAHDKIAEGRPGREMEGEGSLPLSRMIAQIEQLGQGTPGQFLHRPAGKARDWFGNISDLTVAVGFPEPALSRLLEIGENFLGTVLYVPFPIQTATYAGIFGRLTQIDQHGQQRSEHHRKDSTGLAGGAGNAHPKRGLNGQHPRQSARLDRGRGKGNDRKGRNRPAPSDAAGLRPDAKPKAKQEQRQGNGCRQQQTAR